MVINISNKDIHRYKKVRKRILKYKRIKDSKISFSEMLCNIKELKEKGIISIEDINTNILKSLKK